MSDLDAPNSDSAAVNGTGSPPPDHRCSTPITIGQRVLHCVVTGIAFLAFFSLGYLAIRHILDRNWVVSLLTASASLMCIPFVDQTSTLRQRFSASLIMPFAVAGLAGFILLYFGMFQLAWFERIFNDKGLGPIGLIVSALIGFGAGALVGWCVVQRIHWLQDAEHAIDSAHAKV